MKNNLKLVALLSLAIPVVSFANQELFDALNKRDYATVQKMLAANPELVKSTVAFGRSNQTPLQTAAINLDVEGIKLLIRNGANVNVGDEAGMTPLIRVLSSSNTNYPSTSEDNVRAAIALIKAPNADLNARTYGMDLAQWIKSSGRLNDLQKTELLDVVAETKAAQAK